MQVTCDQCQSKIRVPDSAAGKKGKCPKCGAIIAIPAAEAAPSKPAPPAPAGSLFDFGEEAAPAKPGKAKAKPAADEVDEVEDYEEEPAGGAKKKVESTGLSIASLILGIVSLLCSCFSFGSLCVAPVPFACAVTALILGFIGMKKGGKTLAIIGICCGGGSILLTIILSIVGFFFSAALMASMGMPK
jgi:predicted Zn finger-like uncharacterized protein